MENPFELLNQKLDKLLEMHTRIIHAIDQALSSQAVSYNRIPLNQFCKEFQISRPTVYAWGMRGLIKIEKVGGRCYVLSNSIAVEKKYQHR